MVLMGDGRDGEEVEANICLRTKRLENILEYIGSKRRVTA